MSSDYGLLEALDKTNDSLQYFVDEADWTKCILPDTNAPRNSRYWKVLEEDRLRWFIYLFITLLCFVFN